MPNPTVRMVVLHEQIYPKAWLALLVILQDRGGLNRIEVPSGRPQFKVPDHWVAGLSIIENALTSLPSEEFEDFCIGEYEEVRAIRERTSSLRLADKFLSDYFEDFPMLPWEVTAQILTAKHVPHA